jgi:hypothetical protein
MRLSRQGHYCSAHICCGRNTRGGSGPAFILDFARAPCSIASVSHREEDARYGGTGFERNCTKVGPRRFLLASLKKICQMVGTTRSLERRFMNKFKELGFVAYDGGRVTVQSGLTVLLHD